MEVGTKGLLCFLSTDFGLYTLRGTRRMANTYDNNLRSGDTKMKDSFSRKSIGIAFVGSVLPVSVNLKRIT